jgi:hypothetical protein
LKAVQPVGAASAGIERRSREQVPFSSDAIAGSGYAEAVAADRGRPDESSRRTRPDDGATGGSSWTNSFRSSDRF